MLLDFFFGMLAMYGRPLVSLSAFPSPSTCKHSSRRRNAAVRRTDHFPALSALLEMRRRLDQTLCILRVHVLVARRTGLALIVRPLFAAQFLLTHGWF